MVDTGAARSMMREGVWRDICKRRKQPTITFPGLKLRALSGHEIPTLGIATVVIQKKKCSFYIVKDLLHDALLGDDILNLLQARIAYDQREVILSEVSYPAVWNTCMPPMMG